MNNATITDNNDHNGNYKWHNGKNSVVQGVEKKESNPASNCQSPNETSHHNPGSQTLLLVVNDGMNHSQVTVDAGTSHHEGSPTCAQGIYTIPSCFKRPIEPDEMIQKSKWDEGQEDGIHDGEVQDEEVIWCEWSSPVHLKNLPDDVN